MEYLNVAKAVETVTGERPGPSKCWRWSVRGVKGIRLQTWKFGGKRVTTLDAVRTFIEDVTAASNLSTQAALPKPSRLSAANRRKLEKALNVKIESQPTP